MQSDGMKDTLQQNPAKHAQHIGGHRSKNLGSTTTHANESVVMHADTTAQV